MTNLEKEYISAIEEIIKYQIKLFGSAVVESSVKNLPIHITSKGTVLGIIGNPQFLLQTLINKYYKVSGLVFKANIEPIMSKHPNLLFYVLY